MTQINQNKVIFPNTMKVPSTIEDLARQENNSASIAQIRKGNCIENTIFATYPARRILN